MVHIAGYVIRAQVAPSEKFMVVVALDSERIGFKEEALEFKARLCTYKLYMTLSKPLNLFKVQFLHL